MKAKIILKIEHSDTLIAVISKVMDVPSVYIKGSPVLTEIPLPQGFNTKKELSIGFVDLETNLVHLKSIYPYDVTSNLEAGLIPDFLQSLKDSGWSVDERKETVEHLINPKIEETIENKRVAKRKPKLLDNIGVFSYITLIYGAFLFWKNNYNIGAAGAFSTVSFLIVGLAVGYYVDLRAYNKAKGELSSENKAEND